MPTRVEDDLTTCFIKRLPFTVILSDRTDPVKFGPGIILGKGRVMGWSPNEQELDFPISQIQRIEFEDS